MLDFSHLRYLGAQAALAKFAVDARLLNHWAQQGIGAEEIKRRTASEAKRVAMQGQRAGAPAPPSPEQMRQMFEAHGSTFDQTHARQQASQQAAVAPTVISPAPAAGGGTVNQRMPVADNQVTAVRPRVSQTAVTKASPLKPPAPAAMPQITQPRFT